MKISVDDKELFSINAIKRKVFENEIRSELFDEDIKRRIAWIIMHKYERCFQELKKEWDPKLSAAGIKMIPTDPDAYAELVFSQPSYRNASERFPEEIKKIIKR